MGCCAVCYFVVWLCCGVLACIGGLVRLFKFGLAGFDLGFGCFCAVRLWVGSYSYLLG